MRLIPVWALRPGMEVARKVALGSGAPLLNAGVILQQDYIRQLKKLGIRSVYIHDHLIPDVEVEDVILDNTRDRAVGLVSEALGRLGRDSNNGSRFNRMLTVKKELTELLDDMTAQLLTNRNLVINLADIRHTDNYTFAHSVNVAVLAMVIAIAMGRGTSELRNLGMGAFLHDLGKVIIPATLLNKESLLTDEEWQEMRRHPLYGLQLLQTRHLLEGPALMIIHQHHERTNGTGYPLGLQGDEVHAQSRVCAVADVYDALVSDRPYRPSFRPDQAMTIMESEADGYDLEVLQIFFQHVAAYPVGTLVGLNNGLLGVVVANRSGYPTRPRVRVLCERESFAPIEPDEIALADKLDLVIERVYGEEEVPPSMLYGEQS